jgi:DNA-binding response OmpR family regulator
VVSSQQCDDRLWGEVLNLGGEDLLAQPFVEEEVVRVLGAVCRRWRSMRRPSYDFVVRGAGVA